MRKDVKLSLGGIKYLQLFILLISFIILFFNGLFALSNASDNLIILFLIVSAVIVAINWMYALIYDVAIKKGFLHIENLYKHKEMEVNNFISMKRAAFVPFLYKVKLVDRNVYSIGSINLMLKEFTANTDQALKDITAELRKGEME